MLDNEAQREFLRRIIVLRLFQAKTIEMQLEALTKKVTSKNLLSQMKRWPTLTKQAENHIKQAVEKGDFKSAEAHFRVLREVREVENG